MLMPYLDYMLSISNSCTDKVKTQAKRIVNRSLRIALRLDSHRSVNTLHDKTGIMKLDIGAFFAFVLPNYM